MSEDGAVELDNATVLLKSIVAYPDEAFFGLSGGRRLFPVVNIGVVVLLVLLLLLFTVDDDEQETVCCGKVVACCSMPLVLDVDFVKPELPAACPVELQTVVEVVVGVVELAASEDDEGD